MYGKIPGNAPSCGWDVKPPCNPKSPRPLKSDRGAYSLNAGWLNMGKDALKPGSLTSWNRRPAERENKLETEDISDSDTL